MIVSTLSIKNFRCFQKFTVELDSGLNIIYGPNASGKTSLLEAIHILGLTKSNRTRNDSELIKIGTEGFVIQGEIKEENAQKTIMVLYSNKIKKVKVNNSFYKTLSDFIGCFNVVVFSPSDLFVFLGAPAVRRRELDLMLCQVSKQYLVASTRYNRLLKERNFLLKEYSMSRSENKKDLLLVITEQLIKEGKQIISFRDRFLKKLNKITFNKHLLITKGKENLILKYCPSVLDKDYKKMMESFFLEDVKRGNTACGPHRDDFCFLINDKNVSDYGSQGQRRNAILTVKLAFVDLVYEVKKKYPVLLLDDVFSEFDETRQNHLIQTLDKGVQTIITTATLSDIDKKLIENAKLIKINIGGEKDGGY